MAAGAVHIVIQPSTISHGAVGSPRDDGSVTSDLAADRRSAMPAGDFGFDGSPLEVAFDEGVVTVTVRGPLDADAGAAVRAAANGAVHREALRLDIDLRQVTSFTPDGAAALRACRPGAAGLTEGLHYRTGRGPGREALLAAYLHPEHHRTRPNGPSAASE
ncbi:MAG: hypothetical protein ACR2K0_07570 [Acidimicrobiales bacterium]